jgi:hypothetical protein
MGSSGLIPNRLRSSNRELAPAANTPRTTPMPAGRSVSRSTNACTARELAPNAIRIPTSRRRRMTMYETTPYTPLEASTSARALKDPATVATDRDTLRQKSRFAPQGLYLREQAGVEPLDCRADTPREQFRVGFASHEESQPPLNRWPCRQIQVGRFGVRDVGHVCISDDAYDFQHRLGARRRNDRSADGIPAGPEASGGRLGYHRGSCLSVELCTRERAAADDGKSEHCEVLWRDGIYIEFLGLFLGR